MTITNFVSDVIVAHEVSPSPPGFAATSSTSMTIGTGSKTFTVPAGLAYKPGARVRVVSAADPADYMEGDVTSYAGTSMTVNFTRIGPTSAGTASDWSVVIAGDPGSGDLLSSLNGADFDDPDEVRANLGIVDSMFLAAARSDLKAVSTVRYKTAYLIEAGRGGIFVWMTGNYSARIAADTAEGIYIKATAISASVGAWVRTRTEGSYDVKWFGAKGDNTTDDQASIQAAINLCQFHSGGDVLFSQGGYLVVTGLTVSVPLVRLVGVGQKYCSIFTNTANISVVTITAARCAIERLSLFQQVQCGIASAIVSLEAGAVQCTLDALDIVGGYYCFRAMSGTADNLVTNCVMRLATGGAIAYCQGAGTVFFKRCLFNQDWVSGGSNPPAPANDRGARANSTAYVVKDFVTLGGFYLQCTTAGTSGGSAPSLTGKWYGQPITDGGAVFYMANNSAGVAVLVDSGCIYIEFEACDFTGAFNYGAQVANNLGTTAPDVVRFIRCTSEGTVLHNFFVSSVNRLLISDCEMKGGVGNSVSNTGIYLSPSVAGDVTIRGNQIVSEDYGIWLDKSTTLGSALIEGNSVFGCTYGIYVSPAVKNFQIIGNNCGSSSAWGNNAAAITVAAGASDFYMIATNRVHGSTLGVSDAGTGVNKVVSGLNV